MVGHLDVRNERLEVAVDQLAEMESSVADRAVGGAAEFVVHEQGLGDVEVEEHEDEEDSGDGSSGADSSSEESSTDGSADESMQEPTKEEDEELCAAAETVDDDLEEGRCRCLGCCLFRQRRR